MTEAKTSTNPALDATYTAYGGHRSIAQGALPEVAKAAKAFTDAQPSLGVLILEDTTCRIVDVDLSGDLLLVERKAAHHPQPTLPQSDQPSSQKITLLPRHWQWLQSQADNPSATLRRLIDQARRDPEQQRADRQRQAQLLTYRFCQALCGDLAGFEESMRALYRQDKPAFFSHTENWPEDMATRARALAEENWLD